MAIKFPVPFELAYWRQGFLFKAMEDPARQKMILYIQQPTKYITRFKVLQNKQKTM